VLAFFRALFSRKKAAMSKRQRSEEPRDRAPLAVPVAAALSQPAAAQPAAQPAAPPAEPSCDPESLTVPVADSTVELMATIFGRIVPDSDARLMAASVSQRGSHEWWKALRNEELPLWDLALRVNPRRLPSSKG